MCVRARWGWKVEREREKESVNVYVVCVCVSVCDYLSVFGLSEKEERESVCVLCV